MSRLRRGFTLIEMLVVMAVLALLLSLSVPRYFGNVEKAKESVLRQDLAQIRDAIEKYFGDMGEYPVSMEELVAKKYLRKIPLDPITERVDSWIIVPPAKVESGKMFDVKSGAVGRAHDGTDYATW